MKRCSNVFMYAALFEKILQELYTLFDFVQHPLDMSEIFDLVEILLLDSTDTISLSESCLNEGRADLTKGKSTHVKQK